MDNLMPRLKTIIFKGGIKNAKKPLPALPPVMSSSSKLAAKNRHSPSSLRHLSKPAVNIVIKILSIRKQKPSKHFRQMLKIAKFHNYTISQHLGALETHRSFRNFHE